MEHSDYDVRILSDTGWDKTVLDAVNVQITTRVPYIHTSNTLCERQNCVVGKNPRRLLKQEPTKDWAVLTMNSHQKSSTSYTLQGLFHGGCPA